MPTTWSNSDSITTTWIGSHSAPQFGVPYNSDLLYNGEHTYNEATTPFAIVWLDPGNLTTVWT